MDTGDQFLSVEGLDHAVVRSRTERMQLYGCPRPICED